MTDRPSHQPALRVFSNRHSSIVRPPKFVAYFVRSRGRLGPDPASPVCLYAIELRMIKTSLASIKYIINIFQI